MTSALAKPAGLAVLFLAASVTAIEPVSHYYLGFFVSYTGGFRDRISILLKSTDTREVQYSIEAPGVAYYYNGSLSAGGEVILNLPRTVTVTSYNDQDKGIYLKVYSDSVTVIGQNLDRRTGDSFFALPIVELDDIYVYYGISVPKATVHSATINSSILIVGVENDTVMNLTVTQSVYVSVGSTVTNLIPGREYSFVINRLQTVFIGSVQDLSGTKVVTDKPVSVFSGHECGNVPPDVAACSCLAEQIPPTALWGKVFYTVPLAGKRSYTVKILAAYNSTVVDIYCNNTMESHTIGQAGEFVNKILRVYQYCAVYANKEVLVAQLSHGGNEDFDYGDPMMTLVPATNQYLSKFDFSTIRNPLESGYNHHVNVIVMEQYYQPNMIYLISGGANRSLVTRRWIPIRVNNTIKAYGLIVTILEGTIQLFHANASAKMMTIVYGFGEHDGYGHIGGIYMPTVSDEPSPHISLRPDDGLEPSTIGQKQDVICSISVPPDVDPDTIELGWLNEEDIATNDSRVTVFKLTNDSSNNASNSSNIVIATVIQFNPLFEDDERTYSCFYSKMNESKLFTSILLNNFIIPTPLVQITISDNETMRNLTVGDPLTLDCTVTAVRGISSSVNIVWTTGGIELRRVDNITADIVNDSAIYTDSFEISSLSALDNGREYQCTVMINATQPVNSSDQFIPIFPAPVCFNTTYCGGETVGNNLLSYQQCCFELTAISFASSGQCLLCPKTDCTINKIKDIVFVIDTSYDIGSYQFQKIRELVDSITISLKLNSPESAVGVILFDDYPHIEFSLKAHTNLSTLSPAINPGLPYNNGYGKDTAAALNLLLSSAQNGSLGIRNETSNIAIVITGGQSDRNYSIQAAAAALHAANIFDVYAIGYDSADINELNTIATVSNFVHLINLNNTSDLEKIQMNVINQLCSLPVPRVSFKPREGVVGRMQDITCLITISSAIDPELVELMWTHDNSSITTDSRVTITPTNVTRNPSSFTYTTTIHFTYLMEGDEGNYTCNVAFEDMTKSQSIILQNLTIPSPIIEVGSIGTVEFGIAAILECNAIAVRGITSKVDISWIRVDALNTTVKTVENVTANIIKYSTIYSDQLVTPSLNVSDYGKVYRCIVTLNRNSYTDHITLDFIIPSCYVTTDCTGEPINSSVTFGDCCINFGVAYDLDGRCQPCPRTNCTKGIVKDVVFVIDTSRSIGSTRFQLIRELVENITTSLKINSPESLFGLITFDRLARYQFNISTHKNFSLLLSAINPGLRYYTYSSYTTNTASALRLLLSGGREGGYLHLRDKTSNVAIVITDGYASSYTSLRFAASSLHAANIFDVYAVGIGNNRFSELQLIASDPSFVFSTYFLNSLTVQNLEKDIIEELCSTPTPNVFLRPSHLHQGIIGEAFDLVCSIALSSTAKSSPVSLTWNFTSNGTRVRVVPTTITNDNSIGIIYTTVIQFDYLIEEDEGNYTCSLEIDGDLEESTFSLETINSIISYNITTDYLRIYEPMILQCNANVIKGNATTIDIIWTTDNTQVRRVNNVTASSYIDSSAIYNDSFIIPSLNISDIGIVYECEILVNSVLPSSAKTDVVIPIPGIRCSGNGNPIRDVVFVIDSSGSIGSDNFQLIREFTANITTELFRSSSSTAVGVILFESTSRIMFNLKTYTSLSSILSAINRLPYRDGSSTDTDEALRLLLASARFGTLRLRSDSSKIAIVITDGKSSDESATLSAAAALHASNIFDVYAVGIKGADPAELQGIASSPEFVFSADFLHLWQIQERILPQLCTFSIQNITLQPNGFSQNTVGQRQEVICSIFVPPYADPDDIELGWLNENEIITSDSRVTVSTSLNYFMNNTKDTIIQFDPLIEDDDENEYYCYAIINGSFVFELTKLQNFTIPTPHVQITLPEFETFIDYETSGNVSSGESVESISLNVTVGDPLKLDCTVTAVRGISSSVNIIWTTENIELRRVDNITADEVNDSVIYTDSFEIPSLSAIDNGREYQCIVMINATQPVNSRDQFTPIFSAPVCFNTTNCRGESIGNNLLSYEQCCFELFGVSFASPGQCMICPKSDCTIDEVKDIVFVIDTSYSIGFHQFRNVIEFVESITINLKLNSPESLVGVILFDNYATLLFNLERHTNLSTLSPAINPGLPYNYFGSGRNTAAALYGLSVGAQDGSLGIRNDTSKIAIVITAGRSDDQNSTQFAAAALHAANLFDVYAIGFGRADINELNTIASDPHFVYFTNFNKRHGLEKFIRSVTNRLCSLPVPRIYSYQPSGSLPGVVGEMQYIICSATITSAVDPNSVMLGWANADSIVTADSRVTIQPTNVTRNPSSFTYTTTIQFAYLMEGDEGNYTCNVTLDDVMESNTTTLQKLKIPTPVVKVASIDSLELGEPATLECNYIAVRGITSRVDIVWSTGYSVVRRLNDVTGNSISNSIVYNDYLVTPPLRVGRKYYCGININTPFGVISFNNSVTLDFTGNLPYSYYLGFLTNYQHSTAAVSILLMTSETYPIKFSIEIPGEDYYQNGTVSSNHEVVLNLSSTVQPILRSHQDKGIYLRTDSEKVTVIGQNLFQLRSTSDTFFALPVIKVGGDYVYYGISVPSTIRSYYGSILIVGTQNNTIMKLTVSQSLSVQVHSTVTYLIRGREYSFVINRLQSILIRSRLDLSGTKIITDKPASVFCGHECANVPLGVRYCSHLKEQVPPTAMWGKVYYTAPFAGKKSYTIKIVAAYNSTTVNVYCNNSNIGSFSLDEKEFTNNVILTHQYCAIYSSKDVLVTQFSHGGTEDDFFGDPMMTLVPPANRYLNKFDFSTIRNIERTFEHYVNVIVMKQYYQRDMIYLISGGVTRSLVTEQWVRIQVNNSIEAYAAQISISEGVTQVYHSNTSAQMMTIVYGFARNDAYGHIGGIRLPTIAGQKNTFENAYLQISNVSQNTIGQMQDVNCSISVPSNVDPDTIELGWLNENDIVTNDSRVTIIKYLNGTTNLSSSVITTAIRFNPLFEDDKGAYSCYSVVNESIKLASINLQNFMIPTPLVQITLSDDKIMRNLTIGDPLTLNCNVTAVRGISSSVNIIWTTGDIELRRVDDITADLVNDSAIYTDSFEISLLSAIDNGREYQCTVMINATQQVDSSDQFVVILDAPVCFNTTHCGGTSIGNNSLSYGQCCFELSGVSFAAPGQCLLCPKSDCTTDAVKDIVFVIDTSYDIESYQFQIIREFVDNITISLKLNSPESSVGIILFDNNTRILFNLEEHTSLSTLSPAINPGLPYNNGYGRDTAAALNLLLSSAQNGSLGIRNETSSIAIVITGGQSDSNYSTQTAAAALHAANIFDVYAIGYGNADINELNAVASDPHFVHFINISDILDLKESQLNVTDQLCSLPIPRISLQPSRGVIGNMQDIICLITITSAIDPNSVELTWTYNDGNITADNRVTIIPTNVTGNPSSFTYTATIQFAYLMEGDIGNYTCKVSADNMIKSHSIVLQNLRIPRPVVEVSSSNTVEYGQPATLECNVTAARGITSRVDIIWSNGLIVKTVENVTANIVNNSAIYSDQLVTPPLLVNDSGRIYYCNVSIKATFEITSLSYFTLDFVVPSCYITPSCIGEPINKSITFYDCCKSYGIAFDLDGQCQSCPSTNCSSHAVRDVVFVIDVKRYRFDYSRFELIRDLVENITTALKVASPETLFGLITYSRFSAYYQFNILTYTNLSTLLPAINLRLRSLYSSSYSTNIPRAISLLLSGGREGGYLRLRNQTSNVAIVISDGYSISSFSLRSAAASLHAANIYDVYAVGVGNHRSSDLRSIASDPSFIFSTYSFSTAAQQLGENVIRQLCSTPPPRIFLRNSKILQRTTQNAYELVCLIVLSSTVQSSLVNLAWNYTSNDTRIRVTPPTITTDDSIGISYSTEMQFDYLIEGTYACTVMIDGRSAESTFNFINYNVSIISNPPGYVIGNNNTYEYFYGTDVTLTCSVSPTPPLNRLLSWGCSTGCFADGRTVSTVRVSGLDEDDSGVLNCSIAINGIQYYSEPFGLQVITDESCRLDKVTCISEFYPYGLSENDISLPRGDDVTSPSITLSEKFYFYGQSISSVYVGSNGIISLNNRYNPASSRALPISGHVFIAPFWHDVDTRGTGEIYYRQTTNSTLLARATKEIKAAFSTSHNVDITNLFIATWNAVGYFSRRTDKTNTFQCVFATSATESFVLFLYADGRIQQGNSALAGFNAGDGINYETVPGSRTLSIATISRTTNVGIPGIWMFKVDKAICLNGCYNGGVCQFPGLCTCSDGWSGDNCSIPLCPAGCLNGGKCTSPGLCACSPGWTGSNCTQDINECAGDHGCDHLCNNTDGSFYCYCNPGYMLHSNGITCTDIDECLIDNGGCESSCTNLEGINNTTGLGYQCGCDNGYQLAPNNHNCTDANECAGDHGCHHLCNNTDGSFHCYCNPGYMLHSNGTTCLDIDECLAGNGGCEFFCTNLEGINSTTGLGYQCGCDNGYQLAPNNHSCVDIPNCMINDHNCSQICVEVVGSFNCSCYPGYELEKDRATCTDIDECAEGSDGCNHNCTNTAGGYMCFCMDGYQLESDNHTCTDINECKDGISGCQHICKNTFGSFDCSCNPGYTLNSDNKSCIAQPCPTLMMPQNGDIYCNGEHVTDTTCTFQCDVGYGLAGPVNRTCLPNNTWSGEATNCNILLCEELQNPDNGFVILPCGQEYGTICTIECLPGYFTTEEVPVQICNATKAGEVKWTTAPSCQENKLCTPNPCEHSGVCNITGPSSYSCDCNRTGYTGINCEIGIITTPDYQPLTLSATEKLMFYAYPDFELFVELITGTTGLTIKPSAILNFSPTNTSAEVFITGERVGIYTVIYEISGSSSTQFQQLQPATILIQEDTPPAPEYFTSRGLEPGLLEAGSCAFATPLDYTCPKESQQISFSSTCQWYDNASPGIIFSEYNDLILPVAITGTRISNVTTSDQSRAIPLMGNDFLQQCNFDSPQASCNFKPSDHVNEVENFLMTEALGHTFLSQVEQLIPGWLILSVDTSTSRTHDSTSYMIDLVESDFLAETEGCAGLFRVEDGIYAVLKYSGSLNFNVNSSMQNFVPQESHICFAINLCEGLNSPLTVAIPNEAQTIVNSLSFTQIIRNYGWEFTINSIAISTTPFSHDLAGSNNNYWFGNQEAVYTYPNSTIIVDGQFDHSFSLDTLQINYSVDGNAYMLYNNFNKVFELGLSNRWDGLMIGVTEIAISVPLYNQASTLLLTGESTPVIFSVGGTRASSKRCVDCSNQQGMAFILEYDIREGSSGIWSELILIPPKLEFGLPTQFSCPINGFIYFDSSFGLQAISMMSTCIDLQLGSFPIINLHNVLYISNECDLNEMCDLINSGSVTSNVNIYAWSMFPSNISELRLGYFMTLLPYNGTRFGVASVISTDSNSLLAKLFQLRVSVLGTSLTVESTIDQTRLYFNGTTSIFGMYPAMLYGSVVQSNEWNETPLNIFGQLQNKFITILQDDTNIYFDLSINNYRERISNAGLSLQRSQQQLDTIQSINMKNNLSVDGAKREFDSTHNALLRANEAAKQIEGMIAVADQEFTDLKMKLDDFCTVKTCPMQCIPEMKCDTCATNIVMPIQDVCNLNCTRVRQVKQIAEYEEVYKWGWQSEEVCTSSNVCWFWTCHIENKCTNRSVSKRYLAMIPIYEIVNETYSTTCKKPCQKGLINHTVEATCCEPVGCDHDTVVVYNNEEQKGHYIPSPACVNMNKVCELNHQMVFNAMTAAKGNNSLTLLRKLQDVNRNISLANLQVMNAMEVLNRSEALFTQSSRALEEAKRMHKISESAYQQILSDNDSIKMFVDLMNTTNSTMHIEILNVTFDVAIFTESPTSLPLDVFYHVTLLDHTSMRRVVVDFQRIELSVRNAAMLIAEDIFLSSGRSRRSTKTARQTNQETADNNQLYFEEKCSEIGNLQEYMIELNNSINSVAKMVISSMTSVTANAKLIENVTKASIELFSQPPSINATALTVAFNVTVNATNVELDESDTELEVLDLLQNFGNSSRMVSKNIEADSYRSWLFKMQSSHNQTATVAGFQCYDFSDCLNVVASATEELLIFSPSPIADPLLDAFLLAKKALLALVESSNITITSASQYLTIFYSIIGDIQLTSYYCAQPPVIVKLPPQRVNSLEGSLLELTCDASSGFPISYKWKRDEVEVVNANLSILTIDNIQLADSGNYTCEATNHIGTVETIEVSVDVQHPPTFFLEPVDMDVYFGDSNNATFQCNATGWPFPGFTWYFKPKNSDGNFTEIPGEVDNEYSVVYPKPENEGMYYCSASNEQATIASRIGVLTVLDASVMQISQNFAVRFTLSVDDNALTDANEEARNATTGFFISLINHSIDLQSAAIENVKTVEFNNQLIISISLTSKHYPYPETSLESINQLVPQALDEWATVRQEFKSWITNENLTINSSGSVYISDSSSVVIDAAQQNCPTGMAISDSNNFICSNCPPGTYQTTRVDTQLSADDSQNRIVVPQCTKCPVEYYQPNQGQISCDICPPGTTTITQGSRSCFILCAPHHYSSTGHEPCSPCPQGSYTLANGSTACIDCSVSSTNVPTSICPAISTTTNQAKTVLPTVQTSTITQTSTTTQTETVLPTVVKGPSSDSNNSSNGSTIIAICVSIVGVIIVVVIALIVIVLIKRHKKLSHHDMDDKSDTINLKSLVDKPTNINADNECVFSNPSYQDDQDFNGNDDNELLVHSKS